MMRQLAKRCAWGLAAVVLAAAAGAYAVVWAALPRRSGEAHVAGLAAPVAIELDAHAIPRIQGTSFEDALRGEGYMHAQERYFQMDLLRRSAAGELAALVGARAVPLDAAQAPFDLRARARAALPKLPAEHRGWLAAYTEGVNAGLADLKARPPEYWLLGAAPTPWRDEDSLLVVLGLYTRLSNNESYELGQGVLHEVTPPPLYEFLTPSTSRFDRPLAGTAGDPTGGYSPLPIPGPDVIDLRSTSWPSSHAPSRVAPPLMGPASNQWALDASRTVRGDALLANDPHLDLRVPNTFYRAELEWPGGAARGASIPGLPGILIGASDALAWGATVSNADQSDWVVVDVDPADPGRYFTPEGSERFATATHTVEVAGGAAVPVQVTATRWGPIVAHDPSGRPLALHATWLEPDGLNVAIVALATARSAAEGAEVVARWAGPSLNWMLADSGGRIGWAVNGPLPRREGFDGSRPTSWADGARGWRGERARPTLLGHDDGVLFTANNRTLPSSESAELSRMWMTPLRAHRIAELLGGKGKLAEADSLAMQLDTRAEAYDQIRDVVLEVVPSDEPEPLLVRARAQVQAWNGRADVDQPGFRILHVYYRALLARALGPLLAAAVAADPAFVFRWPLADEPLRRLLDERPPPPVSRGVADWPTFLRAVLLDALRDLAADGARPGPDASWGEVNMLAVAHPLAGAPVIGPLLGRWLEWPAVPLPGAPVTLRVATPTYGALLRMSVSPAHPEDGILELAGGQSGHFLSPNFADMLGDWVNGKPTPFLAGPAASRIVLAP
jgi:penicillin amidase